MVGTAREAEFLLRVALLASQFRPWVQDCGMPASQRGILHHQPSQGQPWIPWQARVMPQPLSLAFWL